MSKILDNKEILILEMIRDSNEPIGSWNIVNLMAEENIETSSATIGRILNKLENLGYVQKEKYRGRVITDNGLEAILLNKQMREIARQQSKLNKFIDPKLMDDFLTVLEARKTIERGTIRLAAIRATKEEIEQMDAILSRQENKYKEHKWITEDDVDFHTAIARASKNTILETMYSFLGIFGQQSKAFEFMRETIHAEYMVAHRRILNTIRAKDPDEAEKAMLDHIDSLIADVNKYWKTCLETPLNETS